MSIDFESDFRLLFVTPRTATWVVDGIMSVSVDGRRAGVPVSIEVERPSTPWIEASMASLLLEWSEEQRVVTLDIRTTKARPQACLNSAETSLRATLVRMA